jgi:2-methylcitrate dehydratase
VEFSQRFPAEMPCRIMLTLQDGRVLTKDKRDYEGFLTRPMQWDTAVKKFEQLTRFYISHALQIEIEDAVNDLDAIHTRDLTALLGRVKMRK